MRNYIVAILAIAMLLVGFGTAYSIKTSSTSATTITATGPTSTTTVTASTVQTGVGESNGLSFRLAVNVTPSLHDGVNVTAVASDYNPLTSETNVTPAHSWSVPTQVLDSSPCALSDYAVGVSIAQGHYTTGNLSSATLLDFVNPGITYLCTEESPLQITSYTFDPMSDTATLYGSCSGTPCGGRETVASTIDVGGYYQDGILIAFPPGQYTVVGGDEWGYSAIEYFTVPVP